MKEQTRDEELGKLLAAQIVATETETSAMDPNLLAAYAEGNLDESERRRVAQHLLHHSQDAASVAAMVDAALLQEQSKYPRWRPFLAMAAVLALALLLGPLLKKGQTNEVSWQGEIHLSAEAISLLATGQQDWRSPEDISQWVSVLEAGDRPLPFKRDDIKGIVLPQLFTTTKSFPPKPRTLRLRLEDGLLILEVVEE